MTNVASYCIYSAHRHVVRFGDENVINEVIAVATRR